MPCDRKPCDRKRSSETSVLWFATRPRARPRRRSAFAVFIVPTPPDPRLVASQWRAIEPLVHAPQAVQSARIRGIGVIDDAVLEHECAHTRLLARVGRLVGAAHRREYGGAV